VFARLFLSRALAEIGRFDAAMTRGEEALRAAEALGLPFAVGLACHSIGFVHLRAGDSEKALPLFERSEQISQSAELPLLFAHVAPSLGSVYLDVGRTQEAIALLERGRQLAESKQLLIELFRVMANLAEAYSSAGRTSDALTMARRTLDLSRERSQRGAEAWALYTLGGVCARADPSRLNEAEDAYQHALTVADEFEMRPLSARCQLALGRLHQQMGQRDRGHAQTTNAAAMFREMGMQSWADRAEVALHALD
jgi:tetratricopeptide (TPR) repeat protein